MRRSIATLFLFLYFYNIVGYLALLSFLQYRARSEIKAELKLSVPRSELTQLVFHTDSLSQGAYPLQWLEDHEFRYNGNMFDIVRSHCRGDSTYFECINDTKEEQLFAHLDSHVHRHMGDSGLTGKFDSFKNLLLDSFVQNSPTSSKLTLQLVLCRTRSASYNSINIEISSPPPRPLKESAS